MPARASRGASWRRCAAGNAHTASRQAHGCAGRRRQVWRLSGMDPTADVIATASRRQAPERLPTESNPAGRPAHLPSLGGRYHQRPHSTHSGCCSPTLLSTPWICQPDAGSYINPPHQERQQPQLTSKGAAPSLGRAQSQPAWRGCTATQRLVLKGSSNLAASPAERATARRLRCGA